MSTLTRIPAETPQPDPPGRPTPSPSHPWRPLGTAVLTLLVTALMNAPELLETAEGQPLGWRRDTLVEVASVAAEVADVTRLDRPRRWAERLLDRERGGGAGDAASPLPTPVTTAPVATTIPIADPDTADPPESPGTTVPERRRPTAEEPLRLWILGDSMMQVVGQSLVNAAGGTGVIDATLEYRVSTGLTRPDYFDWPGRMVELMSGGPSDAVVVMFGANDAQGIVTSQGPTDFGTDPWIAEYRARVAPVMDFLAADGRRVYWVGQPVMRSERFSGRMAALNDVYRSEAERRTDVTYVDSWAVFGPDGGYAAYLDDGSGPTLVRQSDGIHLTRAGGDRLAAVVLAAIRADWFPTDHGGSR